MTPETSSKMAKEIAQLAPVVPVIVIERLEDAEPLAKALVAGGLVALEVTLRTPVAFDAIKAMSTVEGGVVGVGTLLTPEDVKKAKAAGAQFGVSPGATDKLLSACEEHDLPILPGAATVSEAMKLYERGYSMLKFFPAEASGGVNALKSIGAPLPQVSFCPTGGVNLKNLTSYLSLKNVVCAGGSWILPTDLIKAGEWQQITDLAAEARELGLSAL